MGISGHVMAMNRVQQRLTRSTAALDRAGVRYAVVGGNAVAAWVGRVDPGATRATKDVDLLVSREDLAKVTSALTAPPLNFTRQILTHEDLRDIVLFIDPDEPSKKSGVHLVWAGEKIRPSYTVLSPLVDESERDPEGFLVVSLAALVRMKLTSYRPIDQAHVTDLLSVGLIGPDLRAALPAELALRLADIERGLLEHE